jgi:glycosyltransferase involved in cell wall biosynthesis
MNVAQVTINFTPVISGVGQVVYDMSSELARQGHNVTVLTGLPHAILRHPPKREAIDGFGVVRFPTYYTGLKLHIYDPYVRGLVDHVLKYDYDIIHCHSFNYFDTFACAVLRRMKMTPAKLIVQTHHPFDYAILPPAFAGMYKTIKDAHVRFILNACDQVLAITPHDVRGMIGLGLSMDRILLLPIGIKWDEYQGEGGSEFKRRYNIVDNEKMILFLGRLDTNKGLPFLLESVARLTLDRHLSFKVVIAGEDFGMRTQVEQQIQKLGVQEFVVLAGRLTEGEKVDALKACDFLVLPSSYEGFGLVLLEAQAAGKPVVASRVGGTPYAVQDMQTGFLVSYGDRDELCAKLRLLLENEGLRMDMGKRGREFAKQFDCQALTKRLTEMYSDVIAGTRTLHGPLRIDSTQAQMLVEATSSS